METFLDQLGREKSNKDVPPPVDVLSLSVCDQLVIALQYAQTSRNSEDIIAITVVLESLSLTYDLPSLMNHASGDSDGLLGLSLSTDMSSKPLSSSGIVLAFMSRLLPSAIRFCLACLERGGDEVNELTLVRALARMCFPCDVLTTELITRRDELSKVIRLWDGKIPPILKLMGQEELNVTASPLASTQLNDRFRNGHSPAARVLTALTDCAGVLGNEEMAVNNGELSHNVEGSDVLRRSFNGSGGRSTGVDITTGLAVSVFIEADGVARLLALCSHDRWLPELLSLPSVWGINDNFFEIARKMNWTALRSELNLLVGVMHVLSLTVGSTAVTASDLTRVVEVGISVTRAYAWSNLIDTIAIDNDTKRIDNDIGITAKQLTALLCDILYLTRCINDDESQRSLCAGMVAHLAVSCQIQLDIRSRSGSEETSPLVASPQPILVLIVELVASLASVAMASRQLKLDYSASPFSNIEDVTTPINDRDFVDISAVEQLRRLLVAPLRQDSISLHEFFLSLVLLDYSDASQYLAHSKATNIDTEERSITSTSTAVTTMPWMRCSDDDDDSGTAALFLRDMFDSTPDISADSAPPLISAPNTIKIDQGLLVVANAVVDLYNIHMFGSGALARVLARILELPLGEQAEHLLVLIGQCTGKEDTTQQVLRFRRQLHRLCHALIVYDHMSWQTQISLLGRLGFDAGLFSGSETAIWPLDVATGALSVLARIVLKRFDTSTGVQTCFNAWTSVLRTLGARAMGQIPTSDAWLRPEHAQLLCLLFHCLPPLERVRLISMGAILLEKISSMKPTSDMIIKFDCLCCAHMVGLVSYMLIHFSSMPTELENAVNHNIFRSDATAHVRISSSPVRRPITPGGSFSATTTTRSIPSRIPTLRSLSTQRSDGTLTTGELPVADRYYEFAPPSLCRNRIDDAALTGLALLEDSWNADALVTSVASILDLSDIHLDDDTNGESSGSYAVPDAQYLLSQCWSLLECIEVDVSPSTSISTPGQALARLCAVDNSDVESKAVVMHLLNTALRNSSSSFITCYGSLIVDATAALFVSCLCKPSSFDSLVPPVPPRYNIDTSERPRLSECTDTIEEPQLWISGVSASPNDILPPVAQERHSFTESEDDDDDDDLDEFDGDEDDDFLRSEDDDFEAMVLEHHDSDGVDGHNDDDGVDGHNADDVGDGDGDGDDDDDDDGGHDNSVGDYSDNSQDHHTLFNGETSTERIVEVTVEEGREASLDPKFSNDLCEPSSPVLSEHKNADGIIGTAPLMENYSETAASLLSLSVFLFKVWNSVTENMITSVVHRCYGNSNTKISKTFLKLALVSGATADSLPISVDGSIARVLDSWSDVDANSFPPLAVGLPAAPFSKLVVAHAAVMASKYGDVAILKQTLRTLCLSMQAALRIKGISADNEVNDIAVTMQCSTALSFTRDITVIENMERLVSLSRCMRARDILAYAAAASPAEVQLLAPLLANCVVVAVSVASCDDNGTLGCSIGTLLLQEHNPSLTLLILQTATGLLVTSSEESRSLCRTFWCDLLAHEDSLMKWLDRHVLVPEAESCLRAATADFILAICSNSDVHFLGKIMEIMQVLLSKARISSPVSFLYTFELVQRLAALSPSELMLPLVSSVNDFLRDDRVLMQSGGVDNEANESIYEGICTVLATASSLLSVSRSSDGVDSSSDLPRQQSLTDRSPSLPVEVINFDAGVDDDEDDDMVFDDDATTDASGNVADIASPSIGGTVAGDGGGDNEDMLSASVGTFTGSSNNQTLGQILEANGRRGRPLYRLLCTFATTGNQFTEQHWYFCYTCGLVDSEGCCSTCVLVCHQGHDVAYARCSRFFCDCGGGDRSVQCLSLQPREMPSPATLTATTPSAVPTPAGTSTPPRFPTHQCDSNAAARTVALITSFGGGLSPLEYGTVINAINNANARVGLTVAVEQCVVRVLDAHESEWRRRRDEMDIALWQSSENVTAVRAVSVPLVAQLAASPLLELKLSTKGSLFDGVNLKPDCGDEDGRLLQAVLTERLVRHDALASVTVDGSHFLTIASDGAAVGGNAAGGARGGRGCMTVVEMSGSGLLSGRPANLRKKLRLLSRNFVDFDVVAMSSNPSRPCYLAVWGIRHCLIFTLSRSGGVLERLAVSLNLGDAFILSCLWLPGSDVHFAVISKCGVSIYDLSHSAISPIATLNPPNVDVDVTDATFVSNVEVSTLSAVVALSSGQLYSTSIVLDEYRGKPGSTTIVMKDMIPLSSAATAAILNSAPSLHSVDIGVYYSHSMQTLIVSASDGICLAGRYPDTSSNVSLELVIVPTSLARGRIRGGGRISRWVEFPQSLPGSIFGIGGAAAGSGIIALVVNSVGAIVSWPIRPSSWQSFGIEGIASIETSGAYRKGTSAVPAEEQVGSSSSPGTATTSTTDESPVIFSLLTNGSIHRFNPSSLLSSVCLGEALPSSSSTVDAGKFRTSPIIVSTSIPVGDVRAEFPVTFFENKKCVTRDVRFGGEDVLRNYASSVAKQRLASPHDALVGIQGSPFRIVITRGSLNESWAFAGVRVQVGHSNLHHVPSDLSVVVPGSLSPARVVRCVGGEQRWYDLPLSDEESLISNNEISVVAGSSINAPMVDCIEVYVVARECLNPTSRDAATDKDTIGENKDTIVRLDSVPATTGDKVVISCLSALRCSTDGMTVVQRRDMQKRLLKMLGVPLPHSVRLAVRSTLWTLFDNDTSRYHEEKDATALDDLICLVESASEYNDINEIVKLRTRMSRLLSRASRIAIKRPAHFDLAFYSGTSNFPLRICALFRSVFLVNTDRLMSTVAGTATHDFTIVLFHLARIAQSDSDSMNTFVLIADILVDLLVNCRNSVIRQRCSRSWIDLVRALAFRNVQPIAIKAQPTQISTPVTSTIIAPETARYHRRAVLEAQRAHLDELISMMPAGTIEYYCNACDNEPIVGLRYHCDVCPDFDLCDSCHAAGSELGTHLSTHSMSPIEVPSITGSVPAMSAAPPPHVPVYQDARNAAVHNDVDDDVTLEEDELAMAIALSLGQDLPVLQDSHDHEQEQHVAEHIQSQFREIEDNAGTTSVSNQDVSEAVVSIHQLSPNMEDAPALMMVPRIFNLIIGHLGILGDVEATRCVPLFQVILWTLTALYRSIDNCDGPILATFELDIFAQRTLEMLDLSSDSDKALITVQLLRLLSSGLCDNNSSLASSSLKRSSRSKQAKRSTSTNVGGTPKLRPSLHVGKALAASLRRCDTPKRLLNIIQSLVCTASGNETATVICPDMPSDYLLRHSITVSAADMAPFLFGHEVLPSSELVRSALGGKDEIGNDYVETRMYLFIADLLRLARQLSVSGSWFDNTDCLEAWRGLLCDLLLKRRADFVRRHVKRLLCTVSGGRQRYHALLDSHAIKRYIDRADSLVTNSGSTLIYADACDLSIVLRFLSRLTHLRPQNWQAFCRGVPTALPLLFRAASAAISVDDGLVKLVMDIILCAFSSKVRIRKREGHISKSTDKDISNNHSAHQRSTEPPVPFSSSGTGRLQAKLQHFRTLLRADGLIPPPMSALLNSSMASINENKSEPQKERSSSSKLTEKKHKTKTLNDRGSQHDGAAAAADDDSDIANQVFGENKLDVSSLASHVHSYLSPSDRLASFARTFLLMASSKKVRLVTMELLRYLYVYGDAQFRLSLRNVLWRGVTEWPQHGRHANEFMELLTWFARRSVVDGDIEDWRMIAGGVVDVLQRQNDALVNHPNAYAYTSLRPLVALDGYYLESEPCSICTGDNDDKPFVMTALSSLAAEGRFTDSAHLASLKEPQLVSSVSLRISEIQPLKMLRTVKVYFNSRTVSDLGELKNRIPLWKLAGTLQLAKSQKEVVLQIPLPVAATNIMIEYAAMYEDRPALAAEKLVCPRCKRTVTDRHGICSNCSENAFQCRQCRNINYENLRALLCIECGHCKYMRVEISLVSRPTVVVESIENDDDWRKATARIDLELATAHRLYQQLRNAKVPIMRLLSGAPASSKAEISAPGAAPVAATVAEPMPPVDISTDPFALLFLSSVENTGLLTSSRRDNAEGIAFDNDLLEQALANLGFVPPRRPATRQRRASSNSQATTSTQQAKVASFVNPSIVALANMYNKDCRTAFQSLRQCLLVLRKTRAELISYECASRGSAATVTTVVPDGGKGKKAISSLETLWATTSTKCFGCSTECVACCMSLLATLALVPDARNAITAHGGGSIVRQLFDRNLQHGDPEARVNARRILCTLVAGNETTATLLLDLLRTKMRFAIEHHLSVDLGSALRSDMALLTELCAIEDNLWKSRYQLAVELFYFAVNDYYESPVVTEHIILPLLRIFDDGIAATNESTHVSLDNRKNNASDSDVSKIRFRSRLSNDNYNISESSERTGTSSSTTESSELSLESRLQSKYGQRWLMRCGLGSSQDSILAALHPRRWALRLIFSPSSQATRLGACCLLEALASGSNYMFTLVTSFLDGVGDVGESASEFLSLYQRLVTNVDRKLSLLVIHPDFLSHLCDLITKEISRAETLELSSAVGDMSGGFVLQSLVSLLVAFIEEPAIERRFKRLRLVPRILQGYLRLRRLLVQRTKLTDESEATLLRLLERLTTGTLEETQAYITACIAMLDDVKDTRTPVFLLEQVCNIVCPERVEQPFLMVLKKTPTQEEFVRGAMTKNPYSSSEPGLGPNMRDVKNKICTDLELFGLLEDDNGMELLVDGKIIALDLLVRHVYDQVWRQRSSAVADVEPPMVVVYRLQGLDGEATEDIVDTFEAEEYDEVDPEQAYAVTSVLAECGGLSILLNRLANVLDFTADRQLATLLVRLLRCSMVRVNRIALLSPQLHALETLLSALRLAFESEEHADLAEGLLTIIRAIVDEARFQRRDFLTPNVTPNISNHQLPPDFSVDAPRGCLSAHLHIPMLVARIGSPLVRSKPSVRRALACVLPFLAHGNRCALDSLVEHFQPFIDFDEINRPLDELQLETFVEMCEGLAEEGDIYDAVIDFKTLLLDAGLTRQVAEFVMRGLPEGRAPRDLSSNDEWAAYAGRIGLPFALRVLGGCAQGHTLTQLFLLRDIKGLVLGLHRLEHVSSENELGSLAENILEALRSQTEAAAVVDAARAQTKEDLRQLALAKREQMLRSMGLKAAGGDSIIAEETAAHSVLGGDKLTEEKGHVCTVCREGYSFKATDILGIYTYSKHIDFDPFYPSVSSRRAAGQDRSISRRDRGYTTVTHFTVVHVACHRDATWAHRGGRHSRSEWEGAELRNAGTKCNSLLPLLGPSTPLTDYATNVDQHFAAIATSQGRVDTPRFRLLAHDLCSLLLRFAHEELLSVDSMGGGHESNIKIFPAVIQMGLHLLDERLCGGGNATRTTQLGILTSYLAGTTNVDSSWDTSSRSVDGIFYMMIIGLWLLPESKWRESRFYFLKKVLHICSVEFSEFPSFASCRSGLIFFALVDRLHAVINGLCSDVSCNGLDSGRSNNANNGCDSNCFENTWGQRLSERLRDDDMTIMAECDKVLSWFETELLPAESIDELIDICGLLPAIIEAGCENVNSLLRLMTPGATTI